jgi:hypothetical protein
MIPRCQRSATQDGNERGWPWPRCAVATRVYRTRVGVLLSLAQQTSWKSAAKTQALSKTSVFPLPTTVMVSNGKSPFHVVVVS